MEQVEMTELEELECMYSELHKDAYGVKARWYRAETVEQARSDLARLSIACQEQFAVEEAARQRAVAEFEERVLSTIESGAGSRETALRWIHDAEGTDGDNEALCYELGLPYHYFN